MPISISSCPLAFERNGLPLAGFGFQGIARLKPGIAITQANADLTRLLPVWMDSWSNGPGSDGHFYENWRITPAIRPLKQEVVGGVSDVLWVVMATIGLVMLIACANVTNLLLVRAEVRRQELALRSALGAGTGRIVGALLVESVTLGLIGRRAWIVVAEAGLRLLVAIGPANLPRLGEISMDPRRWPSRWCFPFLGILLRIDSRSQIRRTADLNRSAQRRTRREFEPRAASHPQPSGGSTGGHGAGAAGGAGLMIRTFQALRNVQPGFTDPQHLQTMRISIPRELVADAVRATHTQNDIADKLAAIPGVTAVGFAGGLPMEGYGGGWDNVFAEDKPDNGGVAPMRLFEYVSPGYFQTAGTRLLAGRGLTWIDVYGQRPVVMVSANLARELWGSPSAALGKRLREYPMMPWKEVIGVVEDVHENGVEKKPPETVYWPTMMPTFTGPPAWTQFAR
jgi:energy-converting hydrogenase Eha subunit E